MVKERYCSFEIAKLLEEKGFDIRCKMSYSKLDKELEETAISDWGKANQYNAPTQQMACDWLEENHIVISLIAASFNVDGECSGWTYEIWAGDNLETSTTLFLSKENVINEALKYCLENLI